MKKIDLSDVGVNEAIDIAQEAITLATLNHQFIIKYFDSFRDEGFFCIVTDYCDVKALFFSHTRLGCNFFI